jgi:serine/threonine-protein kinase
MAFWKGRVTTVHVVNQWKGDRPASGSSSARAIDIVQLVLAAAGVLAAILLARRNWRLGRVDRKGALRIGIARFVLAMVVWLGTVHAIPSSDLIALALASLANWLCWGAAVWLLCLALEPAVRANWPHSIVTWNRILAGRWKDALVGSHILIGALAGAALWVTAGLVDCFTHAGLSTVDSFNAVTDTRHWLAFYADGTASALQVGLVIFFALTGLRRLVKKDPIAAALAAIFFTFINGSRINSSNWKVTIPVYLLIFAVLLLVLLRYGLVTIVTATFFINSFDSIALGGDWKAWYAPAGLATLALLAGIATYGFWRSLGSGESGEEAAG